MLLFFHRGKLATGSEVERRNDLAAVAACRGDHGFARRLRA